MPVEQSNGHDREARLPCSPVLRKPGCYLQDGSRGSLVWVYSRVWGATDNPLQEYSLAELSSVGIVPKPPQPRLLRGRAFDRINEFATGQSCEPMNSVAIEGQGRAKCGLCMLSYHPTASFMAPLCAVIAPSFLRCYCALLKSRSHSRSKSANPILTAK